MLESPPRDTGVSPESAGSLSAGAPSASPSREPVLASTYSPSTYAAAAYPGLRGLAAFCSSLGLLTLVLTVLAAVAALLLPNVPAGFPRVAAAIACVLAGIFGYVVLRLMAETVWVLLDIESNSRRTARLLEDLARRRTDA